MKFGIIIKNKEYKVQQNRKVVENQKKSQVKIKKQDKKLFDKVK